MSSYTFAIGDIHGRLDLLRAALTAVTAHDGSSSGRIICLGDYVDRGPESKGVVETLMALDAAGVCVCLKGNHEQMMVDAIRTMEIEQFDRWMDNGGEATLESFGLGVPKTHIAWLENLPLTHRDAHRLYVHAGVAPNTPMESQSPRALLWIREAFLTAEACALPCHVVHGHTPYWRMKPEPYLPECLPHRTNLDTGAYFTGVLSVGVFDDAVPGGPVEVLSITAD